ncbi:hypothetical protein CALVIDRAFT_542233 [Calocera viscosa TUFC12733]|uniref:Uncharacterized protein n=1 Tax=Calocera viscosa (strain TUFC12733) TaxID=1330018 RepID=A0A167GW72_CALVF|nr:hypothetical protein CALVIDRAFT_542233 [Calocera viscosa TUFC12733]
MLSLETRSLSLFRAFFTSLALLLFPNKKPLVGLSAAVVLLKCPPPPKTSTLAPHTLHVTFPTARRIRKWPKQGGGGVERQEGAEEEGGDQRGEERGALWDMRTAQDDWRGDDGVADLSS